MQILVKTLLLNLQSFVIIIIIFILWRTKYVLRY